MREIQERLPSSLFIRREDAMHEVRSLQKEMDRELDNMLDRGSSSALEAHDLVVDYLELAADGLLEISLSHGKDPTQTAEVLHSVKGMTNKVVLQCLDNETFLETMLAVARKDFNVFQHSVHLAMYAILYSTHNGYLVQDLQPFVLSAMLHDIGMVFLPDEILKSTRVFTDNEFGEMEKHPKAGHAVLRDAFDDSRVARVALEHHERLDGSGYPIGHNDLHEWSQIVAIFEIFDGMVGWRPHRKAPGPIEAIQVLVQMAKDGALARPLVESFCTSLVGKVIN